MAANPHQMPSFESFVLFVVKSNRCALANQDIDMSTFILALMGHCPPMVGDAHPTRL
jgi:hypothetical protein